MESKAENALRSACVCDSFEESRNKVEGRGGFFWYNGLGPPHWKSRKKGGESGDYHIILVYFGACTGPGWEPTPVVQSCQQTVDQALFGSEVTQGFPMSCLGLFVGGPRGNRKPCKKKGCHSLTSLQQIVRWCTF